MAAGVIWKVVKAAATKIPWGTMVENTPALLDLVERARDRFQGAPHNMDEQLRAVHEENMRLAASLLETSEHLQEVTRTLEVVVARQKTIMVVAFIALLTAASSMVLWFVKS